MIFSTVFFHFDLDVAVVLAGSGFAYRFCCQRVFQLVGSFWMGGCRRLGRPRHLALQPSSASHSLGENSQLHTGSQLKCVCVCVGGWGGLDNDLVA